MCENKKRESLEEVFKKSEYYQESIYENDNDFKRLIRYLRTKCAQRRMKKEACKK
jgi:hypothetical protein